MEETDTKPGTLKLFQRGIGKLFLVAAGMGAVVLVIFVAVPMLTAPVPEPPPMQAEEIVAEVLGEPEAGEEAGGEAAVEEAVDGAPTPLVPEAGLPVEAEPPAAIYPAEEETTFEAGLPPVLSPEEIEAALSEPAPADSPPAEPALTPDAATDEQEPVLSSSKEALAEPVMVAQASAETRPVGDAAQPPAPPLPATWQPELAATQGSETSRIIEITLPPPEATREVQELLESLGYEPGPVDGVWGDKTARAWKSFARDAADLEARVELAQASFVPRQAGDRSGQTFTTEAPSHPEISAPPSGGVGVLTAPGAGQVERPLEPEGERTRVPGTLRGVMGYRLPLISRQEVPDQIVSGVLIPAHTTFVILRGGEWELVGLAPDEVKRLEGAAEAAAAPPESEPPPKRGWNLLRLFRRQAPHQGGR